MKCHQASFMAELCTGMDVCGIQKLPFKIEEEEEEEVEKVHA